MTARELLRKLRRLGAIVHPSRGRGGHQMVELRGRVSVVPVHGKRDLPTGTLHAILRDLDVTLQDLG